VIIRELGFDEVPEDARVPFGSLVFGAVENDKVIAVLGAITVVLLDPIWVDPNHRPFRQIRGLWRKMKQRLMQAGVHVVFGHSGSESMSRVLRRIGGQERVVRQFLIPFDPEAFRRSGLRF
jgi:hypothetical protein